MDIANKIASSTVSNKIVCFLLCLVPLLYLGSFSSSMSFNNDAEVFLKKDDPLYLNKRLLEAEFSKDYTAELLVQLNKDDLFDAKALKLITDMTNDVWQVPHVKRVNSLANFQYMTVKGDDLTINELIETKDHYDANDIRRVMDATKNDAEVKDYLINDAYNLTAIRASLNIESHDEASKMEAATALQGIIANHQKDHDIEIWLAGSLGFDQTLSGVIARDAATVELPMIATFIVLIGIFMRSIRASIAAVMVVVISVMGTMGSAFLLGMELSGANIMAVYLIMFLGLLDCVHLLTSYRKATLEKGDCAAAMTHSLGSNLEGLFFTTLTTMIGFLALYFTGSTGFQELGMIGAIGICIAFFVTVLMVPAVMLLGAKAPAKKAQQPEGLQLTSPFKWLFLHHEKKVLIAAAAILVVIVPSTARLYVEDVPIEMFAKNEPVRVAHDLSNQQLAGALTFNYVLDSGSDDGVYDVSYMQAIEKFSRWLESKKEVTKVRSYADVVKRLNKRLHGDDAAYHSMPDDRALLAQYSLLYELSLPSGAEISDQVTVDKRKLKLEIFTRELSNSEQVNLYTEINHYLDNEMNIAKYYSYSHNLLYAYTSENTLRSSFSGWIVALIAISICMLFVCRSLTLGIITLLPNIIPILMTFGIWGLVFQKLTVATVILLLGIGFIVDDTIHFIIQFRKGLIAGLNKQDAILRAFDTAGRAIILSTTILTFGFLIPAIFSTGSFNTLSYSLFTIMVVSALLFDLLVLPSILLRVKISNLKKPIVKDRAYP